MVYGYERMAPMKRFVLMHKNIPVVQLTLDTLSGAILSVDEALAKEHVPVGIPVKKNTIDRSALYAWWRGRSIPASRAGLQEALTRLGVSDAQLLPEKCLGLSLSDQYWIRPVDAAIAWEAVNFFENPFSEDVGNILLGGKRSDSPISLMSPDNTSDGWLKKKWMIQNGKRCLIKGGSGTVRQEPYNEVFASRIMERLQIPHVSYGLLQRDGEPYSICENFLAPDTELISAWYIMQVKKKPNHVSLYRHYLDCCATLGIPGVTKQLDRMLVLDYLIVNEDRHQNNFGVVRDAGTLQYRGPAPVYDCGTSLWFDKPTGLIGVRTKTTCKPFKASHEEQIQLVQNFDWIDFGALDGIEEELQDIARGSDYLDGARCDALCRGVKTRVSMLKAVALSARQHMFVDSSTTDIRQDSSYSGQEEKSEEMDHEIDLEQIDLDAQAPAQEPARQYYFIARCRRHVQERSDRLGRPLTAAVVTFGCQMNARDSEKLSGILEQAGYVLTENEEADFVIYNTCTVRDNANQRVYGRLGFLNSMKKKNPDKKIALCGCMMQEPSVIEKLKKSYRFVDLIFGTHNLYRFPELLCSMFEAKGMILDIWKETDKIVEDLPVERKYPFKSGINIMFGCNNFCSYCIVPYVRGRERSRRAEDILAEIRRLAKDGVVEVMLLGQNVNSYGKNLEHPMSFAQLLREVEKIEGIERIRFMTSHPKDLSDELIEVMKHSQKICRHLHLPLQSGSTRILEKMNRRYTKEQYLALAQKIKREIPDISLTTDIIVGFPGETPADVEETIDVIRQVQFDNAFTFIYSKRTGTPAAAMENQVEEAVVKEGFDRVLKVVQDTAKSQVARLAGQTLPALVEEVGDQTDGQGRTLLTGRLSNNTIVHFPGEASMVGKIVDVVLEECHGFYYIGRQT